MFKALMVNKGEDKVVTQEIVELNDDQLPADGNVTVAVEYSTVNYKDGLCINATGGLRHPLAME